MSNYKINDNGLYLNYDYLKGVIDETLKHEKVVNAIFSIIFVTNEEIRRINKEYRNIDKVTDVISFAFEDNLKIEYNNMRVLGDIYICIPKMIEQAAYYGHSKKRELSFLTVHGLLHLLGYDHTNKDDEEKMFTLQELILSEQGIER